MRIQLAGLVFAMTIAGGLASPAIAQEPPPPVAPASPHPVPAVKPKIDARTFGQLISENYPTASRRAGEEGNATLTICVGADGKVSNVVLVKSTGFPRLDEASIRAMKRAVYTPALDNAGRPIPWCDPPLRTDIMWRLPKVKLPPAPPRPH